MSTRRSASVPLEQVIAWRAPQNAASSALERAHLGAEDELAMRQDARDRVVDGAAEAAALRGDVDERDWPLVQAGVLNS